MNQGGALPYEKQAKGDEGGWEGDMRFAEGPPWKVKLVEGKKDAGMGDRDTKKVLNVLLIMMMLVAG